MRLFTSGLRVVDPLGRETFLSKRERLALDAWKHVGIYLLSPDTPERDFEARVHLRTCLRAFTGYSASSFFERVLQGMMTCYASLETAEESLQTKEALMSISGAIQDGQICVSKPMPSMNVIFN